MMMAHDSSPTPPHGLAGETVELVRSALATYVATPERDGAALRAALRTMADEARDKSVLPEQLLVVLKDIWFNLAPVTQAHEAGEHAMLLQRVVTMCIKEYYT
jgi:hypothetical protein